MTIGWKMEGGRWKSRNKDLPTGYCFLATLNLATTHYALVTSASHGCHS